MNSSMEQPKSRETEKIPEFLVRRERGLEAISKLLSEGNFEDIGDEEAVFMLSLIHEHPEREDEIMRQLKEYKPHVADQEGLRDRVLKALASSEGGKTSSDETGQSEWEMNADVVRKHIVRLVEYFKASPEALGIKKVVIIPSDDILRPQTGRSFNVSGEVIIMSRSGAWDNFDHEFLHSIINPVVENAVGQLSDEDKKMIIGLASSNLKHDQMYGEHPESLLQETIIRTYVNYIQEEMPRPDKANFIERVKSLTEEQFEKIINENFVARQQFDQLGIKTLDDLLSNIDKYYDSFNDNKLRERVYDLLKEYQSSEQSFGDFLNAHMGTSLER